MKNQHIASSLSCVKSALLNFVIASIREDVCIISICLQDMFNADLLADQQQLSLFPNTFSDEDRLPELVQTMLSDLEGGVEVVRHHVLVLFDTVGYQLTHVRAVMVTPSLDIAQNSEQDWSQYIAAVKAQWLRKSPIPMFPEISRIEVSTLLQKLWLGKNLAPSKKSWNVPQKEKVDYC